MRSAHRNQDRLAQSQWGSRSYCAAGERVQLCRKCRRPRQLQQVMQKHGAHKTRERLHMAARVHFTLQDIMTFG